MRKLLILIALPLLFSCSIMKQKKESHKESATEINQVSTSSTVTLDTSKITTNEYWRITIPAKLNVQPVAQTFPEFTMPDLSGASEAQRKAALDLQRNYTGLLSAYKDQGKALNDVMSQQTSYLMEMVRQTQENAGKSTTVHTQDTLNQKHSQSEDVKEKSKKEQLNAWHIIAIVGILAFVVVKIFR